MKIFSGWVVVGAGIVVTCMGMGAMLSLGIFLFGSFGIGLGAMAIAVAFRTPRLFSVAQRRPSLVH